MKIQLRTLAWVIAAGLVLAACDSTHQSELVDDDDVLLVLVDDRPITLPMLEALMEIRGVDEADEEGMRDLLDELIRIRAMANVAEDEGVASEPRIRAERSIKDMETLYSRYVERMQEDNPLTDSQVRQVYEDQVDRSGQRQFQVETIAYPDQSSALQALETLEEDELDFADLGQAAGQQVQPVGWIDRSQVPDRFAVELDDLEEPGVVSLPLEFQNQWMLVNVTEMRDMEAPSFEEMEEGIRRQLNRERVQEMIDAAYESAEIEPMLPMEEATGEQIDGDGDP